MKKKTHDEISIDRPRLENIRNVKKLPVVAILNNIRSTYNVGSIFRTSDGAMIEKLYCCGFTPAPPKKEILKTALGSTESVTWEYAKNPMDVVLKLKNEGYKIAALELTEGSIPHYKVPPRSFPLALIIGNEITGVAQELLDECDMALEIPQYGIKQSLNVAVAYGISIFELRRLFDESSSDENA
jgi:tRNA G18 (ribose-2'-O)-methylase SpoU